MAVNTDMKDVKIVLQNGYEMPTSTLKNTVSEVLEENSNVVEDYKNGKKVFDYMIGLVMKKTRGKANPVVTSKVLSEELAKIA